MVDITFKLSGNSDRPAYPGFIVMKTAHDGSRWISVPSNTKVSLPELIPVKTICEVEKFNIRYNLY